MVFTSAGAKIGASAWEFVTKNPKEAKKFLQGFYRLWKQSKRVLILGPGGVGKSTLRRLLAGQYDFLADGSRPYDSTINVESEQLKGNENTELLDAPGQPHRRDATWPELERLVSSGKIDGVVLCCAYGYHSLGLSTKYTEFASGGGFDLDAYLKRCRDDELMVLQHVRSMLSAAQNPCWLLTVVTKADLWVEDETAVRRFYETGDFGKVIGELAKTKGAQRFRHEAVYGSLTIRSLVAGSGEELRLNTAGYDHRQQAKSLLHIMGAVHELLRWQVKR